MKFNTFIFLGLFLNIFSLTNSGTEAFAAAIFSSSSIEWLAFGDLRGHLEPCGCDPNSDLGSVQRLDAYLRRERMLHSHVQLFHLGNDFTNQKNDLSKRKDKAIAEAIKLMAPTASLLNRQELMRIPAGLPELPYVISNFDGKLPPQAKEQIIVGDEMIFGFVESFRGFSGLQPFSSNWLKKIKSIKSPAFRILLFSGSSATLVKISNSSVFDVIIASNTLPEGKDFGDEERREPSRLIAHRDSKQEILMVPVGGQGVIRSPALQIVAPALPVSSLLAKPTIAESGKLLLGASESLTPVIPNNRVFVKWLDPTEQVGVSQEILSVIDKYRNASNAAMQELIKTRASDLATSSFIGAEACQSCHAGAFKQWQNSKHAHAIQTIKTASRDSDPECVSCHVVGFSAKGGFASETASPHLANVQCESCHGPRRDHVKNPSVKSKSERKAKDACAECHTPPHSPRYNFPEYWKRVEHK